MKTRHVDLNNDQSSIVEICYSVAWEAPTYWKKLCPKYWVLKTDLTRWIAFLLFVPWEGRERFVKKVIAAVKGRVDSLTKKLNDNKPNFRSHLHDIKKKK